MKRPAARSCRGFTLVESLLAVAILSAAGTAVLLGLASTLQVSEAVVDRTIAAGLAEQLMDEIAGAAFMEPGLALPPVIFGLEAGENGGSGRELYDDIDDYHDLVDQPPADLWGVPLGTDNGSGGTRHSSLATPLGFFDDWRREVSVLYLDPNDPATPLGSGVTSSLLRVEVRVYVDQVDGGSRELTTYRRIFSSVPSL